MSDAELVAHLDRAPCGLVLTHRDGAICWANRTFATWVGSSPEELRGRRFPELLSVGGRIHFETHLAPLLTLTGSLEGIAVDLVDANGVKLPMFVTAGQDDDDTGILRITVHDATERRAYERELLQARKDADTDRERVQLLAATLQRSLVPARLNPPEGLHAAAYYHTASRDDVGGDFYDLFPLTRRKWGFFLGDVSGKGAGAAAVTSLTRYTLRAAAAYDDDPKAVLHNLNSVLGHEFRSDDPRFCTVVFGVINPAETGFDVELAAGGHPPALVLPAHGPPRYVETVGGQAVGILREPRFVSSRIHLDAGDTLALYTDGLTEARIGATTRYNDDDELLDFAAAHCPTTAEAFIDALRLLLDSFGQGLEDDAAVIAFSVAHDR